MAGRFIRADASQFGGLARALRLAIPAGDMALKRSLVTGGQVIAEDARSRARFSTRIPGSIRVQRTYRGVRVVAGGPAAPDAAPLEHHGQGGTFRHPVYGHRDVLVYQPAHPFLSPAVRARGALVTAMSSDAVYGAVKRTIGGK